MKFIIAVFVFLVASGIGFYYFFLAPPRDLGIKSTEAAVQSAYTKNWPKAEPLVDSTDSIAGIKYEGNFDLKSSFTDTEISSLVNADKYAYQFLNELQIKINPDGVGEVSGRLNLRKLFRWIAFTDSTDEIEKKVEQYHIGFNPSFYLKGKISIVNNKITLNPQSAAVGRISLPLTPIQNNLNTITAFLEKRLNGVPNLRVRSLNLTDGQVNIDATMPQKVIMTQQ